MRRHLPPSPPSSIIALLLTFPVLAVFTQPLHPSSSIFPDQVVKDPAEWSEQQKSLKLPNNKGQFLRANSRVERDDATMAEALHSMLSQVLANQQEVLANQEQLIRNQQFLNKRDKYLFSQQKLVAPYLNQAKDQQEIQKPDNVGLHWGKGKTLEKMRRDANLEKEKLRWETNLEKEKLELGLPDHLQPSRILISNFR